MGCSGDTAGAAPSVQTAYFALVLNEHAVNMAVTDPVFHSNVIQLTATAYDAVGSPLAGLGQVTFQALDSAVSVSPTGLVTAHYPTNLTGTKVVALLRRDNVTQTDTAYIRVTAAAPLTAIDTFSIQPQLGDSAVRAVGDIYAPAVYATDIHGVPVAFIHGGDPVAATQDFVWLESSRFTIARLGGKITDNITGNTFSLTDTGHVTLYATAWVYGVSVKDSLQFLVTWPLFKRFRPASAAFGQKTFLGVGGVLEIFNLPPGAAGIVFDDSTVVDSARDAVFHLYSGSGNMYFPATPVGPSSVAQARSFPRAGTYHYHSQLDPTQTGTIFVLNNPQ